MYCSRRGREVSRPTDTCTRCGRCHWDQDQDSRRAGRGGFLIALFVIAVLLAAAVLLIR